MFIDGGRLARVAMNCWGAQAASLSVAAACRGHFARAGLITYSAAMARVESVSGKLPETAGWQPALPGSSRAARLISS